MNRKEIKLISIIIIFILFFSINKIKCETTNEEGKHIVFVHQLSSWSHCVPMMTYSEELLERGYKISFASFNQILDIAKRTKETNLSLQPINLISTGDLNIHDMGEAFMRLIGEEQTSEVMFSAFTKAFNSTYPPQFLALSKLVKETKIDLFSCDIFAQACMDVANINKIPFIITFPTSIDHFGLSSHSFYPHYIAPQSYKCDDHIIDRFYTNFVLPIFDVYYGGIWKRFLINLRESFGVKGLDPFYLRSFFFPYALVSEWNDKHVLVDDYFFLAHSRPISPLLHVVGPSGDFSAKENNIDQSLLAKLDSAKERGVVLIATGSQAMMTPRQIKEIEIAFSVPLPGKSVRPFLIFSSRGSNIEFFPKDGENSITLTWVPQKEVLAHPSTVLFLSHGGLGSVYESIFHTVPLLLLPLFGDQPRNSAVLKEKFLADVIDSKLHFTWEEIRTKANNVLSDKRFEEALEKTSKVFRIRNKNSAIRAADIYEEVLVDYQHLVPLYVNVSFWKEYQLDLYFAVLLVIFIHIWVFKRFVFSS